jgi:hypothetical protein
MHQQLTLFQPASITPDLSQYDRFLVAFSGGKDSICCVLKLLELGIQANQIELHHHLVDGREGSTLFDWPVTEDYCRKFAEAIACPIYYSWLEGGLEREMCRDNQPKAPTHFETPEGIYTIGGQGQPGTRRKFPANSAYSPSAPASLSFCVLSFCNISRYPVNNSLTQSRLRTPLTRH